MDEEEELENTLIGQQEEEAPAVNTEGALMGNIPSNNLVSFVNTTGQQSDAMTQLADTASANIGVPMTGMRPIDPTTGQPLSQAVIDAANRVGLDLPQASVPLPQPASALPALPAVVADQPQAAVSPFLQSPSAPMGQEATRAALGGMTLNEYLNAPASTPGVSGLRTDPQGRMIPNIGQFQAQTEVAQPAVDSGVPATTTQPPASALSSFEQDSLARQQRIGGTGSFAGDSAAREARLAARPDFNEVRRDRDRRGGISQADARDLAQGMDRRATEGERMRALEIQSRLGLGQFKPEREPTELEKREIESRIRARDAEIARSETKADFQPRLIDVGGERAMELSPGYFQRIPKDTPNKTGLQKTLENLQSDLDSGRLTQEEYDIATKNATDLYIGREKPKGQTTENEFINIITGAEAGDAPTGDATDAPQVATRRGQARRGRPIETGSEFTPEQEIGIQRVMADNDITRERAIQELKKAGKLK